MVYIRKYLERKKSLTSFSYGHVIVTYVSASMQPMLFLDGH